MEDILTQEEVQRMIDSTDRLDKKAMFSFLYLTGCRIGEALNMRTTDFGWQGSDYLFIKIKVEKRKEEFYHTIKISFKAPFMRYLLDYLNTVGEGDYLWKVDRRTVWKWCKMANPKAHPHLFRHTRLTRLAEKGATDLQLMVWAGWTNTKMSSRYVRATPKIIEGLADEVV